MKVVVRKIQVKRKGKTATKWRTDYFDQFRKRHRKDFDSSAEAHQHRQTIEEELRKGTHRPNAQKKTVKELADEYLEYITGRRERGERMTRGSYQFYVGHLNNYILATPGKVRDDRYAYLMTQFEAGIGEVKLMHLTPRVVSDFRDRLRNAGLTVITTRKVLVALSAMMQFAQNRDYIAKNPCHGVQVIGPRNEVSQLVDAPAKEDLAAVIAEATPQMRIRILFAASTGVRAGEMHALRWEKVDLEKREVKIDTSLDKYGIEDGQGAKTAAGNRVIPIGAELAEALSEWRKQTKHPADSDPVFPSPNGCLQKHSTMLQRQFFPIFDRLEAKHRADPANHRAVTQFRWHALRHFAISSWIEAGLAPKVVQKYAGHSSLAVTMDRYTHVFKSADHHNAMDQVTMSLFGASAHAVP
jgi:integrase